MGSARVGARVLFTRKSEVSRHFKRSRSYVFSSHWLLAAWRRPGIVTRYATEMGRRPRFYLLFRGRDRWCEDVLPPQ